MSIAPASREQPLFHTPNSNTPEPPPLADLFHQLQSGDEGIVKVAEERLSLLGEEELYEAILDSLRRHSIDISELR